MSARTTKKMVAAPAILTTNLDLNFGICFSIAHSHSLATQDHIARLCRTGTISILGLAHWYDKNARSYFLFHASTVVAKGWNVTISLPIHTQVVDQGDNHSENNMPG